MPTTRSRPTTADWKHRLRPSSWFVIRDPEITDEQRRIAALDVALDLVDD
jgi:hypothetical protein